MDDIEERMMRRLESREKIDWSEETADMVIAQREIQRKEALNRISPKCNKYNSTRNAWKVLFLALLSSVCTYYGVFQFLVPYLFSIWNFSIPMLILVAASIVGIYSLCLYVAIRFKMFETTNLLILYGIIAFVSLTGLMVAISDLIPIGSFEILKLFVVVIIFNMVMIMASFYLTRWIVCRIDGE